MNYKPDGNLYEAGLLFDVREFAPNNNKAYKRIPSFTTTGYAALPTGAVVGSAIVKDSSGAAKWFAGSPTKLYQADGVNNWTNRSGAVTFTAVTWDFCTFGDYTIAAANEAGRKLQVATTGNFADIGGAPAGCSVVYVHANAVIALGPNASWARSVTGDHTNFTAAANNDADAGTLYGGIGGPITAGCCYGNLAIVWKSRAMYAGVYVGNADPDQDVLRWQVVPNGGGCVAKDAWVETEIGLVYVSERDILLFNGGRPTSIADDIRKTWLAEMGGNRTRIIVTLDEASSHVYFWGSPAAASYDSRAYVWNYRTGQWGRLFSYDDNTGLSIGDPRCAVRNANYVDYVALAGTTNANSTCNLVFDAGQLRPVNLAGTTYASKAGLLRTGFIGKPDRDTRLHRVYLRSDAYSTIGTTPTLSAFAYDAGKNNIGTYIAGALTAGGYWDPGSVPSARWWELQASFPAGAGQVSVADIICELQDAQVIDKTRFLV